MIACTVCLAGKWSVRNIRAPRGLVDSPFETGDVGQVRLAVQQIIPAKKFREAGAIAGQ
jgi:hypothetical protein